MAKLVLTTVLLVALAGVAKIEAQQQSYGQDAINSAANYAQNIPAQMQNQLGQQQGGGLLSGLLGNGGSNPLETLRQLPARGLSMLNNMLSGVRNTLGLGGNGNNSQNQSNLLGQLNPDQLLQGLPKNPITDIAQGLLGQNGSGSGNSNGLRLPNLNQITNPIMEPLQQGRLPDVNELTRGAQNTVSDLTNNLMTIPSNLGNTLNGAQQGRQQSGGLGGLLSSLGGQATTV